MSPSLSKGLIAALDAATPRGLAAKGIDAMNDGSIRPPRLRAHPETSPPDRLKAGPARVPEWALRKRMGIIDTRVRIPPVKGPQLRTGDRKSVSRWTWRPLQRRMPAFTIPILGHPNRNNGIRSMAIAPIDRLWVSCSLS
jgi:hypothetical protein